MESQGCSDSDAFLEDATVALVSVSEEMLTKAKLNAEKLLFGIENREFSAYTKD